MIKQVNLTINFDWSRVSKAYDSVILKTQNDSNFTYKKEWVADISSLGPAGIIIHDNMLSTNWNIWSGPMLLSLLPWRTQLNDVFQGLTIHSISFLVADHNISKHTDGRSIEEQNIPFTNLNYIIRSDDSEARTFLYDLDWETILGTYSSTPNTAWIINPDYPHEVEVAARREVFQIKFANSFQEVYDFLNTRQLVLG